MPNLNRVLYFGLGLYLGVKGECNGELGADQLAIATGQAFGFVLDGGQAVALVIELCAHVQHFAGAKFRAKTASFASYFVDVNVTERLCAGVLVKRSSPQLHG